MAAQVRSKMLSLGGTVENDHGLNDHRVHRKISMVLRNHPELASAKKFIFSLWAVPETPSAQTDNQPAMVPVMELRGSYQFPRRTVDHYPLKKSSSFG